MLSSFVPLDVSDLLLVLNMVAGLLGVPIMQFIKGMFNIEGKQAMFVTVGVSVVLSIMVYFATGAWVSDLPVYNQILQGVGVVLATATAFYKFFVSEN